MKKNYILFIMLLVGFFANAQVQLTQIYTDYNGFWTSSSTNINPVQPNLQHNLLAFRYNGTVYSTGANNAKLTENGISFENTKFRALPILSVPFTGGSSYYRGVGSLTDGTLSSAVTGTVPAITTGEQKAALLTDGIQGLGLGSGIANLPSGNTLEFNLSSNGITLNNIGDGVPDILVSQIATPDSNFDQLYFVDAEGVTVGKILSIDMTSTPNYPTVGNWNVDFFENNGTAAGAGFVNTPRVIRFFSADLTEFGITSTNASRARKLVYKPGGTSDPAFLAFNEPSIGVAAKLAVATQPTATNCDGSMTGNFTVKLQDTFGFDVAQAGYAITASMYSGPGQLLGTVTAVTNAQGLSTFSALNFEVGGDHKIQFNSSSLASAISANIAGPTNCAANTWTGNVNTAWNNTGNWQTGVIPNANNNVTIPTGRPYYPVLTANAGAKDLVMGAGAIINLNGYLFTIKGDITKNTSTTTSISGSTTGSELYMSGLTAQTIPSGFINGYLYNFTSDNAAGVTTNASMFVTNVVKVNSGNFATNGNLTLVCSFAPHKTAQIGVINGSITGNVTTEQCYPARRAFRLLTSGVTTATSIHVNWQENATAWNNNPNAGFGTHITGTTTDQANGFDFQPSGSASMFTFNNATQAWASINNTNVNTLTAGAPYRLMIRGSRSTDISKNATAPTDTKLRATGTIAQGTITVNGLSAKAGDVNFVGNPYQSIVDMAKVMGAAANLGNFYTVWDPTLGGSPTVGKPGGRGAYVTVQAASGVSNNTTSTVTRFLQPNQAFFVNSAGGTAQLTFTEADKAPDSGHTAAYRSATPSNIDIALFTKDAYDNHATASDALKIMFDGSYSNDFDANDATKFNNLDENLARIDNGIKLSIESRNQPVDGEELPLSLTQYRYDNYVFVAKVGTFNGVNVFLKDNYLNTTTRLNQGTETTVEFTKNDTDAASTAATRFAVVFKESALDTNNPVVVTKGFTVFPNPANGTEVYINANADYVSAKVAVYNTLGQQVLNTNQNFSSNRQLKLNVSALQAGMYIVKLVTDNCSEFTAKLIKE
jgi:hypothetical protein